MTTVERVIGTRAALDLIGRLRHQHGPLMFHQSGGCCDGSSPMCFRDGEFVVGGADRLLGYVGGCPFYIGSEQYACWRHTQLVIDVVPGRGGMFSLENGSGLRFLTRSRLFGPEELAAIDAEDAKLASRAGEA